MKKTTTDNLAAKGWQVGSTEEFLGLTPAEAAYVECKVVLAKLLIKRRKALRLTQAELAKRIGSSQSRLAKVEKAEPSVSVDLVLRSLFSLGVRRRDIAKALHG